MNLFRHLQILLLFNKTDRNNSILAKVFLILLSFSVSSQIVFAAQDTEKITLSFKDVTLKTVFDAIEEQTNIAFMYDLEAVNDQQKVSIEAENVDFRTFLDQLFKDKSLRWNQRGKVVRIVNKPKVRIIPRIGLNRIKSPTSESNNGIVLDISGNVTDSEGQALIGVNVLVKGTSLGTSTDFMGNFSLTNVDDNDILIVSYIGYQTKEVPVNGMATLSIMLDEDRQTLDEVVVVGYGTVKKSDVTGSLSSVNEEEINAYASANVMQALAGRASGVQVKQNTGHPGGAISIRVRGTTSIVGANEPLYVVDGFPVSSPETINNSSIKSIEILKDASAVAIYGSRASNGVVLITTKDGESGKSKITLESSLGFQRVIKEIEMANPLEYGLYFNELYANLSRDPLFSESEINDFRTMGEGTNWQDVVYQTDAPIQNYSLNIAGGNEKTKFSITGGLFDQQGIIKNSDYKRYSLNNRLQHKFDDKFSVDLSLTLSKNQSSRKLSGQGRFGTSLIGRAYGIPSSLPVYEEDGSYLEPVEHYPFVSEALYSPLNFINEQDDLFSSNNVLVNTSLSYAIIEGLVLKISGGVESRNTNSNFYQTINFQNDPNGRATVSSSEYTSLLNENTLSYNKDIGDKHSFGAVAGFTYQDFITTSLNGSGTGFLSDVSESYGLATAAVPGIPGSGYSKSVLLSGLGRLNYSYDDRYLFTVSFRGDGSSIYTEGNKWGYFPSAAFSWRLSKENFFNLNPNVFSDLRLRASWGKAGNQAISAYSTLNTLNPGSTVWGSSLFTTMSPSTRLAADLKWETTEQVNFGLDWTIMDGRFNFTADYYVKETTDLLNAVQLARSTGYTNSLRNIGRISNKGFELSGNAVILPKGDFNWDVNANISFNRSKVLELYDGQDILAGQLSMIRFTDWGNTYREGEPLGIIYGYEEDGYDENGFLKYKSEEKVKLGDPNPDFIFGLNSDMSYKAFSLSMFFSGTYGNDIINMSSIAFTVDNTNGTNKLKEVINNYWTPDNPDAKYPLPHQGHKYLFSDRYVEDGSYIRMRNIIFTYQLPLSNVQNIANAEIYFSGQNLLTFTKYSWVDPDVNSRGGANSLDQGIDYSTYPSAKSYTFGFRIGF
ncbi:TonB-dependent receptor [Membranihabitans marinus]|uniref:TonB-dependent receptor n=1 Tax=Membranihabitans marinus TaxID=1227546 RepID=UPI001F46EEEB|nr:TonB-dependent receptor [Membranihabitans marinus]